MNEETFFKEMSKLIGAFPHYKATEMTWEIYWLDLQFIPKEKLIAAFDVVRQTGKFFPSVSEIIETAIGQDYRKVKWNPHKPATIQDVIRAYKAEHSVEMALLAASSPKEVEGPKGD